METCTGGRLDRWCGEESPSRPSLCGASRGDQSPAERDRNGALMRRIVLKPKHSPICLTLSFSLLFSTPPFSFVLIFVCSTQPVYIQNSFSWHLYRWTVTGLFEVFFFWLCFLISQSVCFVAEAGTFSPERNRRWRVLTAVQAGGWKGWQSCACLTRLLVVDSLLDQTQGESSENQTGGRRAVRAGSVGWSATLELFYPLNLRWGERNCSYGAAEN